MSCEQSKEQIDLCENKTKYWIKRSEWGGIEATVVSEHSHGLPTSQVHDNIITALSFFLSLFSLFYSALFLPCLCLYVHISKIELYHFWLCAFSNSEIQSDIVSLYYLAFRIWMHLYITSCTCSWMDSCLNPRYTFLDLPPSYTRFRFPFTWLGRGGAILWLISVHISVSLCLSARLSILIPSVVFPTSFTFRLICPRIMCSFISAIHLSLIIYHIS